MDKFTENARTIAIFVVNMNGTEFGVILKGLLRELLCFGDVFKRRRYETQLYRINGMSNNCERSHKADVGCEVTMCCGEIVRTV